MLDHKNGTPPLRDDDGAIRADFVVQVAQAIDAADVAALRSLVGDLHESDLGALLEALEPSSRPRLVELLGIHFDFTALTEVDDAVRDEILEELPPQTVAESVRDIESDDAVAILEDMPKEDRAEILDQLSPPERVALTRSLDYPEDSAGRRMQTEFIAVPPHLGCRPRDRLYARDRRAAGAVLRGLCCRRGRAFPRRGDARPAAAQQAAGADFRTDGGRAAARAR